MLIFIDRILRKLELAEFPLTICSMFKCSLARRTLYYCILCVRAMVHALHHCEPTLKFLLIKKCLCNPEIYG